MAAEPNLDEGAADRPVRAPAHPGSVVFTEPSFCPVCGCDLTGKPQSGRCPDCDRAYRPGSVVPGRAPSTVSIVMRFLWPAALFCITVFGAQYLQQNGAALSPAANQMLQLIVGVAVLGFLINLPLQMLWWRRVRGLPSREPRALRLAAIVLVSVVSAACLVPFLLFGACLVVMM